MQKTSIWWGTDLETASKEIGYPDFGSQVFSLNGHAERNEPFPVLGIDLRELERYVGFFAEIKGPYHLPGALDLDRVRVVESETDAEFLSQAEGPSNGKSHSPTTDIEHTLVIEDFSSLIRKLLIRDSALGIDPEVIPGKRINLDSFEKQEQFFRRENTNDAGFKNVAMTIPLERNFADAIQAEVAKRELPWKKGGLEVGGIRILNKAFQFQHLLINEGKKGLGNARIFKWMEYFCSV